MPGVASLDALQRAVNEFDVTAFYLDVDPSALAAARQSLDESGLLLLGEVHGVRQNPLIARALMVALDVTGLALEWPAGLATATSGFFADGNVPDHPQLWAGDGRITAGHFALLRERFMAEGLQSLTLFDGVNEVGWSRREAAMADRIISAQAPGARTLVIAGNAHTALSPTGLGIPLGARLAERRPGVREIRVNYGNGSYYNLSPQRFKRHWTLRRRARLHSDGAGMVLELPGPVQARVPHRMLSSKPQQPNPPGYTGAFPVHSTGSFPMQNTGALPVQNTGGFPARDSAAGSAFDEPGDHRQYAPASEPAQPYPPSQPYPPPGQPYPASGQPPYPPSQPYPASQPSPAGQTYGSGQPYGSPRPYPEPQPYPAGQPYAPSRPYRPSHSYAPGQPGAPDQQGQPFPPGQAGGGAHARDRALPGRHGSASRANPPAQRRGQHTADEVQPKAM